MRPARARLGSLVRRHRRVLAGLAAFLGVLAALAAITSPGPAEPDSSGAQGSGLAPGRVAIAVRLPTGADLLRTGNTVDLVASDDGGSALVLARGATVLEPASSSFSGSGATVLVSVTRDEGLALAGQPADHPIAALVTGLAPGQ